MKVPKQIILHVCPDSPQSQYHPYSANVHFYFFSNHLTHLYIYIYRQQRITPIVTYYFDYLDMAQVCSTIFGYSFFLKLCILCFFGFQENRVLFHSIVPAFRNVIDVPLVVRGLRKSRSEVCILLEKDIMSQQNSLFLIHMFQL